MMPDEQAEECFVVDRLEGEVAAVELSGGARLDLPSWMLPPGVSPGDLVRAQRSGHGETGRVVLQIDAAAAAARREQATARLRRLRASDPGGDIDL